MLIASKLFQSEFSLSHDSSNTYDAKLNAVCDDIDDIIEVPIKKVFLKTMIMKLCCLHFRCSKQFSIIVQRY